MSDSDSRQGVPEVWPDDVLTDMDNAWRKATDVRRVGHYEMLMAVAAAAIRGLARHRQPAAVSADAVGKLWQDMSTAPKGPKGSLDGRINIVVIEADGRSGLAAWFDEDEDMDLEAGWIDCQDEGLSYDPVAWCYPPEGVLPYVSPETVCGGE